MPLDFVKGGTPQYHTHVNEDIVSYLSSLPDNYSHAMVDDHTPAYLCPGMDLDAGQEPAYMG
jgi:hypothetical protein